MTPDLAGSEAMSARTLTDEALADRLERIAKDARGFPKDQRRALLREAARRLRILDGRATDG